MAEKGRIPFMSSNQHYSIEALQVKTQWQKYKEQTDTMKEYHLSNLALQ